MNLLCQKLIIAIWVISNAEMYSSEVMTIERRLKPPTDVFTIPVSKCDNKNHFCQEYNAKEDVLGCQCYCELPNATFALYQHSWSCVGSEVARTFTDCTERTLFKNESEELSVLEDETPKHLSLNRPESCQVVSSQYIDCNGKKATVMAAMADPVFNIEWDSEYTAYSFEINLEAASTDLRGKIVIVDIGCTAQQSCLMFKVAGQTRCHVTSAPTAITNTKSGKSAPTSEVKVGPSAAADKSNIADDNSFSAGFIAGISLFFTILILVTGISIYFWKRDKQQTLHSCDRTMESSRTIASELSNGDPEDNYATLNYSESGTYPSSYSIPCNGRKNASATLEPPVYTVIEESNTTSAGGKRNHVPFSIEQHVYNLVEDFEKKAVIEEPYEYTYSSIEGQESDVPVCVEQRVYNLVEDLNRVPPVEGPYDHPSSREHRNEAPISEEQQGPCDHSSTREHSKNAPISVEQRVYNLIEPLPTLVAEGSCNQCSTSEHGGNVPISVEQRVYNLIEDLDSAISESHCEGDFHNKEENKSSLSTEQRVEGLTEDLDTTIYEELNSLDPIYPKYYVLQDCPPNGPEEFDC